MQYKELAFVVAALGSACPTDEDGIRHPGDPDLQSGQTRPLPGPGLTVHPLHLSRATPLTLPSVRNSFPSLLAPLALHPAVWWTPPQGSSPGCMSPPAPESWY